MAAAGARPGRGAETLTLQPCSYAPRTAEPSSMEPVARARKTPRRKLRGALVVDILPLSLFAENDLVLSVIVPPPGPWKTRSEPRLSQAAAGSSRQVRQYCNPGCMVGRHSCLPHCARLCDDLTCQNSQHHCSPQLSSQLLLALYLPKGWMA